MFCDIFTDKDYKEVITLVVKRKDGTILVYGHENEPTIFLPPISENDAINIFALHYEAKMLGGQVESHVKEKVEVPVLHDG